MSSLPLIGSCLLLFSMSNGLEFCKKKVLFRDDTTLTCLAGCCGLTAYDAHCCKSSTLDGLKKTGQQIVDSLSGSSSSSSSSSFSSTTVSFHLSTAAIIGISVGSIAFIVLVVGIIACVACSSPSRHTHVTTTNQPPLSVVTTGQTNPSYAVAPQAYAQPPAYPPPVNTQFCKS